MSAVLDQAIPHRIKSAHRRRRKAASGRIVQRYYDPVLGRFLSPDPVQADGNTGASFNRYWYANNNPYKFTDADGRQDMPFTTTLPMPMPLPPPITERPGDNLPPDGGPGRTDRDDDGRPERSGRPDNDRDIRPERDERRDRDGMPIPDDPKGSNILTSRKRDPNFKGDVWAGNKAKNGGNAACDNCAKPVQPGQKLGRGDTIPHDRGEADHTKRLASGGADDATSNGQLLCHECHVDKTADENRK